MKEKQGTILLVEDSPADVILVKEAFRRAEIPFSLEHAEDGAEAMDTLSRSSGPPLLVLLDLNLPGKSGRDVLEDIRATEELRGIPVVILSTSDHPDDVAACYKRGANSYLVKPNNLEEMVQTFSRFRDFWLDCAKLPTH